ncbi:MAG: capsid cement protein [Persicimonas sp.]
MANPVLTKNFDAGAAIAARRIVKWGSSDKEVVQSAAATDFHCGVADWGADAEGDRVDVHLVGTCDVEFGGNVSRGEPLTSDGDGKAIEAVS